MKKERILKIVLSLISQRRFQWFFEQLHKFVLLNMNIGNGSNFRDSGEKFVLSYIKKHLPQSANNIFFDAGANNGDYSLLLNAVFTDKVTIHAFEPSHKTFGVLKSKVGAHQNIIIHNFGLGATNEKCFLYSNDNLSGLASLYQRKLDYLAISLDVKEKIEIKTLDLFCAESGIKNICFLKLDIEGNEHSALLGAENLIKSGAIRYIQFEFGGCNIDSKIFFRDFYFLLQDNYRLYRVLKNGLYPIKQYEERYEIFTTTNFFAEKINNLPG